MYRENLWLIGQYGGFGSPEETNQRFKYLNYLILFYESGIAAMCG
jgi:hypothetical protein